MAESAAFPAYLFEGFPLERNGFPAKVAVEILCWRLEPKVGCHELSEPEETKRDG